jgi:hypothetical protein
MMHHAQSLATNEGRAVKLRALRVRNEEQLNAIRHRKQRLEQQLQQVIIMHYFTIFTTLHRLHKFYKHLLFVNSGR